MLLQIWNKMLTIAKKLYYYWKLPLLLIIVVMILFNSFVFWEREGGVAFKNAQLTVIRSREKAYCYVKQYYDKEKHFPSDINELADVVNIDAFGKPDQIFMQLYSGNKVYVTYGDGKVDVVKKQSLLGGQTL